MKRFEFLILLILLPILTKSKNVHTQRQSSFEDDENAQSPHLHDQIAQSSSWRSTYSGDPAQTGQVDHANLVINVEPKPKYKPVDVDVYASQTLSNAKTAEEYVNKALEMRQKYEHTTPSSSYVKYDIFEGEKTKLMPVQQHDIQPEPMQPDREPIAPKEDITDTSQSAIEYSELIHHPEYVAQTTTTTTYKHPEYNANYKDLEHSNSDYNQQFMSNYDSFDSIKNINYDNQHSYNVALRKLAGYPSKEEMIRYIEKAVKKYLREMNSGGKLSSSLNSAQSAHAEVKTYYRFPSSTTQSPLVSEPTKLYSTGTHSEFFKTGKNSYKQLYETVKPFTVDTYNPEGIDLTVRSKKRPKPIDLSALDVGQSWSHTSTLNNNPDPIPYRKPKKQKIHIKTQTYHDINALPYVPNRGLVNEDYAPYSTATAHFEHMNGHHSLYKDHPIGASISFGGHSDGTNQGSYSSNDDSVVSHKPHFVPSMQVVNGVPVKNPYTYSMDTLNDILDNSGEHSKYLFHDSDYGTSSAAIWNPYNLNLSPLTSHDNTGTTSSYIYDAYSPKYNNNPEEQYYTDNNYQRGNTGSGMYSSTYNNGGSSSRSKKGAVQNSTNKRATSKVKARSKTRTLKRSQQQSRQLDRDLTPPPEKQR